MKIKFIGRGSYYAHPFHFTEKERVHEVDDKLSKYLLKNGKFEMIKETEEKEPEKEETEDEDKKEFEDETQQEIEEKASKEKEKYEKTKKEIKKVADKK